MAGLAAAGAAGLSLGLIAVLTWWISDPVALVDGAAATGGTAWHPQRYCCGMLSWRADLPAVLVTSGATALAGAALRTIPILRSRTASVLLAVGVLLGSLWILQDVVIGVGSGLPDTPNGQRDLVTAWLLWLLLPLAAVLWPGHRPDRGGDRSGRPGVGVPDLEAADPVGSQT